MLEAILALFGAFVLIAVWARAKTEDDFYSGSRSFSPLAIALATSAAWISAASFMSMAGLLSFVGQDGAMYLMGWTGGFVLMATLIVPYLRSAGSITLPTFLGERYASVSVRVLAAVCVIIVALIYLPGQMRGIGVVLSRFTDLSRTSGILVGSVVVFACVAAGGMRSTTYTGIIQYALLLFGYLVPAIFLSLLLTANPIPQLGWIGTLGGSVGAQIAEGETVAVLHKLESLHQELGFASFTSGRKKTLDVVFITLTLMAGSAAMPHVVHRFVAARSMRDARRAVAWTTLFVALLYTTAPAIAVLSRVNLIGSVNSAPYASGSADSVPKWFKTYEDLGLVAWLDKNGDGRVQYVGDGAAFRGRPRFFGELRGKSGERLLLNDPYPSRNEVYYDRDTAVFAMSQIASLPSWVFYLAIAGALAAGLSTAAALLLVTTTSISYDIMGVFDAKARRIKGRTAINVARVMACVVAVWMSFFAVYPIPVLAQVVALSFGISASTLFPPLVLGVVWKRANAAGTIAGMAVGFATAVTYIAYFKFYGGTRDQWWFGISPEGFGAVGMIVNLAFAVVVSMVVHRPQASTDAFVDAIRVPGREPLVMPDERSIALRS